MKEETLDIIDITAPTYVEIIIAAHSKVVWINIDGICRLRACRIKQLTLDDQRHNPATK